MAWKVDPQQSKIEFVITHLKVTTVRGRFESFQGTLEMDEENPQSSSIQGTVDTASLKTGISLRDNDLKSSRRFDVQNHPTMSFRSTEIGPFDGDRFKVYGDLTIKDITHRVVFDIVNRGELPAEEGKRRWTFGASIVLSRKDFDLRWNPLFELGELLVGDEVKGELEIQFIQE